MSVSWPRPSWWPVNSPQALRTGGLSGHDGPDGGAFRQADLARHVVPLGEEVAVAMAVDSSTGIAGQRRHGDGSKSSLHVGSSSRLFLASSLSGKRSRREKKR